jgi:hypothetical protein
MILPGFRQLGHGSQTPSTDIHFARNTIDFKAAALYVQHEAATCTFLREINIIAMHWFAFTYFTTTRHMTYPFYCIKGLA